MGARAAGDFDFLHGGAAPVFEFQHERVRAARIRVSSRMRVAHFFVVRHGGAARLLLRSLKSNL